MKIQEVLEREVSERWNLLGKDGTQELLGLTIRVRENEVKVWGVNRMRQPDAIQVLELTKDQGRWMIEALTVLLEPK